MQHYLTSTYVNTYSHIHTHKCVMCLSQSPQHFGFDAMYMVKRAHIIYREKVYYSIFVICPTLLEGGKKTGKPEKSDFEVHKQGIIHQITL